MICGRDSIRYVTGLQVIFYFVEGHGRLNFSQCELREGNTRENEHIKEIVGFLKIKFQSSFASDEAGVCNLFSKTFSSSSCENILFKKISVRVWLMHNVVLVSGAFTSLKVGVGHRLDSQASGVLGRWCGEPGAQ